LGSGVPAMEQQTGGVGRCRGARTGGGRVRSAWFEGTASARRVAVGASLRGNTANGCAGGRASGRAAGGGQRT
jgi:hypothetical protein